MHHDPLDLGLTSYFDYLGETSQLRNGYTILWILEIFLARRSLASENKSIWSVRCQILIS